MLLLGIILLKVYVIMDLLLNWNSSNMNNKQVRVMNYMNSWLPLVAFVFIAESPLLVDLAAQNGFHLFNWTNWILIAAIAIFMIKAVVEEHIRSRKKKHKDVV
jgi:hypothetical protein